MNQIDAAFPRGTCSITIFGTHEHRDDPVVLFFPDAFGPRPASFAVAKELAGHGWRVVMPDLFYEHAPYEAFEPRSIFEQGPKHDALLARFASITQEKMDEDVSALVTCVERELGRKSPLAAIGYCMGARYALTAACASSRVRFAAAVHGSNLAPLDQDGPHRRFAFTRGRVYVGVAAVDPTYDAAEHGRLAEALRDGDTDHVIETYQGAAHGFVFADIPVHNKGAAGKHMRRLVEHMTELFAKQ